MVAGLEQQLSSEASEDMMREGAMAPSDEEVLVEAVARARQEQSELLETGGGNHRRHAAVAKAAAAATAAADVVEAAVAAAVAVAEEAVAVSSSPPIARRQLWQYGLTLMRWKKEKRGEQKLLKKESRVMRVAAGGGCGRHTQLGAWGF